MTKTLKCQVKPFKVCSDGWKEFLPIREHFMYYMCVYIYIYIMCVVLCNVLLMFACVPRALMNSTMQYSANT